MRLTKRDGAAASVAAPHKQHSEAPAAWKRTGTSQITQQKGTDMSREVRRVPVGWQHPTTYNPHWEIQSRSSFGRSRPASRLHAPTERFVCLMDDFTGTLARWEQEGRDLAARTGHDWDFSLQWHLTGIDNCTCHRGEQGVRHPAYRWSEDGETESPFVVRDVDHLHAVLSAAHERQKPSPEDYMPTFGKPDSELGWCLYETVSEGSPVTPVFATAEELIDHLATVGQDWDQIPLRRASAEAIVNSGGTFGSMVAIGGRLLDSTADADRIAEATR